MRFRNHLAIQRAPKSIHTYRSLIPIKRTLTILSRGTSGREDLPGRTLSPLGPVSSYIVGGIVAELIPMALDGSRNRNPIISSRESRPRATLRLTDAFIGRRMRALPAAGIRGHRGVWNTRVGVERDRRRS